MTLANAHAAAVVVEMLPAAATDEEDSMHTGNEAGSQTHGWGMDVANSLKRLRLSLSTPEALPEERTQSQPFRLGHNIDVIKEETTSLRDEEAGGERGRGGQLNLESCQSTIISSSSEVQSLSRFSGPALD